MLTGRLILVVFPSPISSSNAIVLSHRILPGTADLPPTFVLTTYTFTFIPLPPFLYPGIHTHSQNKSQTSTSQTSIDSTTKKQLAELDEAVKKNREAVIVKIVERVVKCEPKLHQNLKKIEA